MFDLAFDLGCGRMDGIPDFGLSRELEFRSHVFHGTRFRPLSIGRT
jgi:hypothetical protein